MDSDKAEVKAAELLNGTLHLFNVSWSSDGVDQLRAKSKLEEGTFFSTEVVGLPFNLENLEKITVNLEESWNFVIFNFKNPRKMV